MTSHFLAYKAVRLKQPLNNLVPEIRRSRLGGVAGTSRASADDGGVGVANGTGSGSGRPLQPRLQGQTWNRKLEKKKKKKKN